MIFPVAQVEFVLDEKSLGEAEGYTEGIPGDERNNELKVTNIPAARP